MYKFSLNWRIRMIRIFFITLVFFSFQIFAKEELFIYNWSDYIAEDTISNFEEEFGIDVTYDVFDSNEVLEAKLLSGSSGYDIVVPSGSFLENQIKAGVFQKLDKSQIPNLVNLDPSVLKKIDAHDPGGLYSVNYMYGTTGLGYNVNKVDEDEVESWDILFNPNIASKYEDCGISILDAPSEVMEIALKYIGKDPNTEDESDYKEALEMLKKIRPFVRYFDSSQYIDDLASGEICLAMGWSGDVFLAADEAADDIEAWYSIPVEGTVIWFDMMAIPADSKNVSNAHKFINYILRPQVAANITNYVWYSNPNMAANELVDPEIFEDAAIYPDEETLSKLFADTADSPKKSRLSSKYFNKFKSN
jgi:putrescine transport system substrate-binding protein